MSLIGKTLGSYTIEEQLGAGNFGEHQFSTVCERLPEGHRYGVEVRNKPFLKPALLDGLRERGAALVFVDHVWMPPDLRWRWPMLCCFWL